MNVLSLFDGMSCGQIALNKLGKKYDKYFASEIDKYAIQVTKNNYPNTIHLGDVSKVNGYELPKIDLMFGGSPCQNLSVAGKMKGMATKDNIKITSLQQYLDLKNNNFEFDGQSYLFWEYLRILNEVKPKYFLLENVLMQKEWQDIISKELGVEPIMINSNCFVAQSRKRLYWTNIDVDMDLKECNLTLNDILLSDFSKATVEDTARNLRHEKRLNEKALTCTATMYKGAGNNGMTLIRRKDQSKLSVLSVNEVELLQSAPIDYTSGVSNTQRYKMLGNGWTIDVIAHIFKNI